MESLNKKVASFFKSIFSSCISDVIPDSMLIVSGQVLQFVLEYLYMH